MADVAKRAWRSAAGATVHHEHTREVREIRKELDRAGLDELGTRIERQLQGLAQIIDDLMLRVAALESNGLTHSDLARFASGLKDSMERDAA